MKTPRTIPVADHLWELLGRMAEEMGTDREALVNQALHGLARLHGYLPGQSGPPRREPPERRAAAQKVLETAARLEQAIHDRDTEPPRFPPVAGAPGPALVLVREDGREVRVERDRFLIGRGRHCDLVIESTKVSREHVALVREGDGWAIEDLGSANGTWHQRVRIQRRRIEDGDEYVVCAERLRCRLVPPPVRSA